LESSLRLLFARFASLLAARNLRSDRFGTLAAVLGVALGTAVVEVVVVLDANTVQIESGSWSSNPTAELPRDVIGVRGLGRDGAAVVAQDPKQATHEDYEVMRSAIRLGSLSAFLVGALIVFFTFGVVVDRRRREVALLRSLGALPRQVAAIFVREAILVGIAGAVLGLFAAIPLSYLAARAGITTTGRSRIWWWTLGFPMRRMLLIAAVGAATALLGVLRPVRDVLRLDVTRTLRPRFLDDEAGGASAMSRRTRGITLITLPFATLVYVLMRPFFRSALPSLTFFVLEAALVCVAFLATLVLVPDLVRVLGGALVRRLPGGPAAERLLTRRRIEQRGHELAWSVSGVMMVFALLMSLHIATAALKREVTDWADEALGDEIFVGPDPGPGERRADEALGGLPPDATVVRFSGSTPWPNRIRAAAPGDLVRFAETRRRPELVEVARRLGPGKALLSTMMARRHRIGVGDGFELSGRGGTRRLEVVGVTDGLGFLPVRGTYRNAKTYALIDAADYDLIAPYAASIGDYVVVAGASPAAVAAWRRVLAPQRALLAGLEMTAASWFRRSRVRETDRDFAIFDFVLALTGALAALGIANQLVLSVHGRRREIGLYRVIGMTTGQIRRLVLMEGAFVGLLGGALAALLGVPLGFAAVGALQAVSAFQVRFRLPSHFVPLTIAGSLAVSLFASLYPARRAARSSSAESVHYE
jgi:putative ABC transport system permease protein